MIRRNRISSNAQARQLMEQKRKASETIKAQEEMIAFLRPPKSAKMIMWNKNQQNMCSNVWMATSKYRNMGYYALNFTIRTGRSIKKAHR